MTIRKQLSKIQRNAVAATSLAWLAAFRSMAIQRPANVLAVHGVSLAVMLGALHYVYRSARRRCGEKLWLRMRRIDPLLFRPSMTHCPSCGTSFQEAVPETGG